MTTKTDDDGPPATPAIARHPVVSSNLASVGYDPATKVLEVEFRSGSVYRYRDVPEVLHRGLMAARSKGRFLGMAIRARGHACTEMASPRQPDRTV